LEHFVVELEAERKVAEEEYSRLRNEYDQLKEDLRRLLG
jgi:hypothetical protein